MGSYTHLDAIILNLERTCQASIDMAMHVIAENHLGVPQSSADAFHILFKEGRISEELYSAMKGMVGFRNVAIHEYRALDKDIVRFVVTRGYQDLIRFCANFGLRIIVE